MVLRLFFILFIFLHVNSFSKDNKPIFTPEELEYIKNTKNLKIGIESWEPIIFFKDSQNANGIIGDILHELVQISGLSVTFVGGDWNDLLEDFKRGEVDVLPATYYLSKRSQFGLYSKNYLSLKNFLYVDINENSINSFEDLNAKKVAIEKGYATIDIIRKNFPEVIVVETKGVEESIKKLLDGEVDALFDSQLVVEHVLKSEMITKLKPIYQNDIPTMEMYFFMQKNNEILQSIINKTLDSLPSQKRYEILSKWINNKVKKQVSVGFGQYREPYNFENSIVEGLEHELIKAVLKEADIEIVYKKNFPLKNIEKALHKYPKLDMAVTVKKKNDDLFYSDDFISFQNVAITRKSSNIKIDKISDLEGKSIIAYEGAHKYLDHEFQNLFHKPYPINGYIELENQEAQVRKFLNGVVDVIILDKSIFLWYLKKLTNQDLDNFKFHNIFKKTNNYQVAFRDRHLRDVFNKNLKSIRKSGVYKKLFDIYLYTDIVSKTKLGSLFSEIVSPYIFSENIAYIRMISDIFALLNYIEKIEIYDTQKLLYSTGGKSSSEAVEKEVFLTLSDSPQKVGFVKIYFNDRALSIHTKEKSAIPNIEVFDTFENYLDIKEIYKKHGLLEKRVNLSVAERKYIKNHPILWFSYMDKEPYFINEKNDFTGIIADYLDIIQERTGLEFRHVKYSSNNEIIANVKIKSIDFAISEKKIKDTLVSNPFIKYKYVVVSNENAGYIDDLNDLKNQKVGVVGTSSIYNEIRRIHPSFNTVTVKDVKHGLALVRSGNLDAFVGHEADIVYSLKNNFINLKIIGVADKTIENFFIFNKNNRYLHSIFNKVIDSISHKEVEMIKNQWLAKEVNTAIDYSIIYKIVGVFLFVAFLIFLYNRHLKYLVDQKTYELNTLLDSYDKNVIALKLDSEGTIVYESEALIQLSGFEKDAIVGKHVSVLNNLFDKKTFKKAGKHVYGRRTWNAQAKVRTAKGMKWFNFNGFPEYNKRGIFVTYTILLEDITDQKERALLQEEIVITQKEIIFKLGSVVEARSKETGLHVKRVAEYTKLLALLSGLDEDEAEMLKLASPMHDIGKIAIPDAILNKPAKLEKAEFELMKTHTSVGYEMLKDSNRDMLKTAAIIAHEHHEKWDGSGYPRGLVREDIHVYGRITALADVFDALGSDRIYKKAWEDDRIFAHLQDERGKHFDPHLVDLFFDNLDKFLQIRLQYS